MHIDRFNRITETPKISFDDFVGNFVTRLIKVPDNRTIISAFYVFLLEAADRVTELRLRSTEGGSLGPIISHLFSGGLVFESLLKCVYKTQSSRAVKSLGDVFKTSEFKRDFAFRVDTGAESLRAIVGGMKDNSVRTAFCTTARLRNTTGHSLVWDDVFQSDRTYEQLVDQIVNALLFLIEKTFIRRPEADNVPPIG